MIGKKSLLLYPTSDAHIQMGGWQNVCRVYNDGIAAIVKIFTEGKVEEIYFFGYFGHKGKLCRVFPPLAIKVARNAYR